MNLGLLAQYGPLAVKACISSAFGIAYGLPGADFDFAGRTLGMRLLVNKNMAGMNLFLNPVSFVRYFEFAFAKASLPIAFRSALDVASPLLFTVVTSQQRPDASFRVMNPDPNDLKDTERLLRFAKRTNVTTSLAKVDVLREATLRYDCIWSLSVIEHISGVYDDTQAVKWMWDALEPGGRLILTFPVDRVFDEEFTDTDPYGTQERAPNGRYFFQRRYDLASIRERILIPLGVTPVRMRWFGITDPSAYSYYVKRWKEQGTKHTIRDPWFVARHFAEFPEWNEMPGRGVCGVAFEKSHS